MKSKIEFYDLKMEFPIKNGEAARYYGDLMYIIYDRPYCWLHYSDNSKYRVEVPLKYLMDNLPEGGYLKCNRSVVFNICHYKEYRKNPPTIKMRNGEEFKMSRRNILDFKKLKNSLSRISPPCPGCYTCISEDCEGQVIFCKRKKGRLNRGQKEG